MIGEMKFLRAYIYANLIWRYGGVPIITKVYNLNDDFGIERNSYEQCVEFIKTELNEAMGMLPDKQPESAQGRASADACQALLARVLLYWASPLNNPTNIKQRWIDAADAAEKLIDTRYSLVDEYEDVFLTWNEEVIFARAFTQGNTTDFANWHARSGDNGAGIITPTQNMVNAYEMKATGERPYTEKADGTLVLNAGSGYDPQKPFEGGIRGFMLRCFMTEQYGWIGKRKPSSAERMMRTILLRHSLGMQPIQGTTSGNLWMKKYHRRGRA